MDMFKSNSFGSSILKIKSLCISPSIDNFYAFHAIICKWELYCGNKLSLNSRIIHDFHAINT